MEGKMSFRESLLKKIEIDRLADRVNASMGSPESGRRIDRALARQLLNIAGYALIRKRDLELYLIPEKPEPPKVLVLDNDLPIYTTTPEDVAMRKSPLVKEMVKIRNIIKILNDSDVVVSKKGDSVEKVRSDCVATLNLDYGPEDIEEIEKQGVASLENGYSDGVTEALELFAELLNYTLPPKAFKIPHHTIFGKMTEISGEGGSYGPMALYNPVHNSLKLIDRQIRLTDKERIQSAWSVSEGNSEASAEGPAVFAFLKNAVLHRQ
jgi:hypothetical protein